MQLLEYKGKELLRSCGIRISRGIVTNNKSYINLSYHKERYNEFFFEHHGHVILKAQVATSGRKKKGLIVEADNYEKSLQQIDALYQMEWNDVPITTLLIEKELDIQEEYYLSILYDTRKRKPMVLFSRSGGIDVEDKERPHSIHVSALEGLHSFQARELVKAAGFSKREILQLASFISKAYTCFRRYDCRLLEINPIIKTPEGMLFAGDAKITIDDSAVSRQRVFSDVTDAEDLSLLSERALEARKIDYHDHRGVAGKTFLEFNGNIAVLASGGGASLTSMDAILEAGGKPGNYTEYSGNPSREKVRRLTEITLSKPGLCGCLVVGAKANFTDIFETLSGFSEAIQTLKPNYPIVIRRAGPRDAEAFEMLRKLEGFDMEIYGEETSMTEAARIIVEKAEKFRQWESSSMKTAVS